MATQHNIPQYNHKSNTFLSSVRLLISLKHPALQSIAPFELLPKIFAECDSAQTNTFLAPCSHFNSVMKKLLFSPFLSKTKWYFLEREGYKNNPNIPQQKGTTKGAVECMCKVVW